MSSNWEGTMSRLYLLLLLPVLCLFNFPVSAEEATDAYVSFTTGNNVCLYQYELGSKWTYEKKFIQPALGSVGTTAIFPDPKAPAHLFVFYSYKAENTIKLGAFELKNDDFNPFTVNSPTLTAFSISPFTEGSHSYLAYFYQGNLVRSQFNQTTGSLTHRRTILKNSTTDVGVNVGINWQGSIGTEVVYNNGYFLKEFGLNSKGRANGLKASYSISEYPGFSIGPIVTRELSRVTLHCTVKISSSADIIRPKSGLPSLMQTI
jgi:hypothetical protein